MAGGEKSAVTWLLAIKEDKRGFFPSKQNFLFTLQFSNAILIQKNQNSDFSL